MSNDFNWTCLDERLKLCFDMYANIVSYLFCCWKIASRIFHEKVCIYSRFDSWFYNEDQISNQSIIFILLVNSMMIANFNPMWHGMKQRWKAKRDVWGWKELLDSNYKILNSLMLLLRCSNAAYIAQQMTGNKKEMDEKYWFSFHVDVCDCTDVVGYVCLFVCLCM